MVVAKARARSAYQQRGQESLLRAMMIVDDVAAMHVGYTGFVSVKTWDTRRYDLTQTCRWGTDPNERNGEREENRRPMQE